MLYFVLNFFIEVKIMLKKLFAPTDMTVGSPWKGIVLFTLPMLIGNIAQ